MASLGCVDENLRQQYREEFREELKERIAEAVARRRSSVGDSPGGEETPSYFRGHQTPSRVSDGLDTPLRSCSRDMSLTPFEIRAPPPTPATLTTAVPVTPSNRAPPPTPATTKSISADRTIEGRSPAAPAILEFGEDSGPLKVLSPMADRKLLTSACLFQTKEHEGNKENVGNLAEATGTLVWDGQSPVDSPKKSLKDQNAIDKSRHRSSVSSCNSDGSASEASPRYMRQSIGTQEQELRDGLREVELKKKFLMERESKLDQKELELDQRSAALDQSRSELLKYEAEVQASAGRFQEEEQPKRSCRSRTWTSLCFLLRLFMFVNTTWNIVNLTISDGSSIELQPSTSDAGTAVLETLVTNMAPADSPMVHNDQTAAPASSVSTQSVARNDWATAPPSSVSTQSVVIRFQVPWLLDKNGTVNSVFDQACLPAEARNAHLAFDWSSGRVRFLQNEVDRLNAQVELQKHDLQQAHHVVHQCSQVLKEEARPAKVTTKELLKKVTNPSRAEPAMTMDRDVQPKSSVQDSSPVAVEANLKKDPKQTAQVEAPSSWKIGAVASAILGGSAIVVPRLLTSML